MAGAETQFGPFLLHQKLGSGGMATVHLASRSGGGARRWLAVKRLHAHLAENPEAVRLFLREAQILSRLRHPGLCQVEETGSVQGEPYIAMEVLQGTPLHKLLKRLGPTRLPVPLVQAVLVAVCEALHYAHTLTADSGRPLGLVHRDVTPQNIFITLSGEVKLLDFGVAYLAEQTRVTQPGQLKGKWAYLSPEQILAQPLDRRADIFAVGIVGWECLAQRPLFQRASYLEAMGAIVQGQVPRLETIHPELPSGIVAAIHKALSRDPAARFATAQEFGQNLASGLGTPAQRAASLSGYLARLHASEPPEFLAPTENAAVPPGEGDLAEAPTVELGQVDTDALKAMARGWAAAREGAEATQRADLGQSAPVELGLRRELILADLGGSSAELPVVQPTPLDEGGLERAAPTVRAAVPTPPPPARTPALAKWGIIFLVVALGAVGLLRFWLS